MNNLKRILTIALCSVLIVCAIPQFSFNSEAASTATYALYQTLLNLSGYLTTRGYSIVHEYGSTIPSITELQTMSYENLGQRLFDISIKLNDFGATHDVPNLGEQFINAMSEASFRGSILLSKQTRDLVDLWLDTNISDGNVTVGSTTTSITSYAYPANKTFSWWSNTQGSFNTVYDVSVLALYRDGYLIFVPASINDFVYNALNNTYSCLPISGNYRESRTVTYNGANYTVACGWSNSDYNFNYYNVGTLYSTDQVIINYISGVYDSIPGADLVISRITDTSSSDLLTSTNSVSSTGEVEGDTTIYLPDNSTLESAIDSYNNQSITLDEFLHILGINQVASDATVEEKEDALTVVVTPSEDYLWFTKTQWGADSLEETRKASAAARSEEDSLANSIANTLNGGSDPEPDDDGKSRGKGLLALLLLGLGIWNTPLIAGDGTPSSGGIDDGSTNGSGNTSGYLQESIAGMAVAGSIVEDIFSSAGGSDGYGLAYTVGASFVIFSVIIGAANYFGALFSGSDTKQNIKSSGKQTRSKSPSSKSKRGG